MTDVHPRCEALWSEYQDALAKAEEAKAEAETAEKERSEAGRTMLYAGATCALCVAVLSEAPPVAGVGCAAACIAAADEMSRYQEKFDKAAEAAKNAEAARNEANSAKAKYANCAENAWST